MALSEVKLMIIERFGQRIKEIRNNQGISQEKFALLIDMDRTYYASVESGKRNVSINNIEKIAKGFNISLEELFKGL